MAFTDIEVLEDLFDLFAERADNTAGDPGTLTFEAAIPLLVEVGSANEGSSLTYFPADEAVAVNGSLGYLFFFDEFFRLGSATRPVDENGEFQGAPNSGSANDVIVDATTEFEALSEGETTTVSYFGLAYDLAEFDDGIANNFNRDDVVVIEYQATIVGIDDPTILVPGSSDLFGVIDQGVGDTDTGVISFTDADDDTFTVEVSDTNATDLGTLTASVTDAVGPDYEITWTYELTSGELGAGEMATEEFTISIDDGTGAPVTQDVTISITGVNDIVTIDSADTAGTVTEDVGTQAADGVIDFTDLDLTDIHQFSFTPQVSANPGGFGVIATEADDRQVTWSYALNNNAQALGANDSFEEVFTVTIDDQQGSTATQDVTITGFGANDEIVVGDADLVGEVTEDGSTSTGDGSDTGMIAFTDVDLSDTHTANAVFFPEGSTNETSFGTFEVQVTQTDENGEGGLVTWTYTLDQNAADSLGTGDVVVETFQITIGDGTDTEVQDVVITINGQNDNTAPVITSVDTASVDDLLGNTFHTVTATDGENDQLIFSLEDSGDADLFEIDQNGNLSFAGSIDFDNFSRGGLDSSFNPGGKDSFDLVIEVSDGELTTTQEFTVSYEGDADSDGVVDTLDNAILVANGLPVEEGGLPGPNGDNQIDTDGDGYGNVIDFDFAGAALLVDFSDLDLLITNLFTPNQDLDFNNNNLVDFADLDLVITNLFNEVGPSFTDFA